MGHSQEVSSLKVMWVRETSGNATWVAHFLNSYVYGTYLGSATASTAY